MDFLRPASWWEALEIKATHPDAVPIAGGTDVMVALNFGHERPGALVDLSGVRELTDWSETERGVRIGAGVTYARLIDELGGRLPALAIAARTVGSPQIRNRGTIGGNLGSASPAGDAHPPLLASNAEVELASVRGTRLVSAEDFFTGPKRSIRQPDELIAAVHLPPAGGPQQFAKIGPRNAMVIAVCTVAIALWPEQRQVRTGLGSVAPVPRRARTAEDFLIGELATHWERPRALSTAVTKRFGELVTAASDPIDDVRGSASYRRHALAVLAGRTLNWAWDEHRAGGTKCE